MDLDSKKTELKDKMTVLEVVEKFYNAFFCVSVEEALKYLHKDLIWAHYGPLGFLPFYGKFYGHSGFITWVTALANTTSLSDFTKKEFYISEKNIVHTHVLEKSKTLKTGVNFEIENIHSIVVEDEKIKTFSIISETSSVIDAYINGNPSKTKYEHIDYKIEEILDINKTKGIAQEVYKIIKEGKPDITNYIATSPL